MKSLLFFLLLFSYMTSFAAQIYLTGNPIDKKTQATAGICLAGGGDDDGWGQGWKELLEKANGGDVVIIRADGSRGGYEDWIYNDTSSLGFPKMNSVRTLVLEQASDANKSSFVRLIEKAEMIFFAGGDQTLYIEWLRGSKLLKAIEDAIYKRQVPIAGTSAGMALLAGIDYRAKYNSPTDNESMVTASDVMNDPLGIHVDLKDDVLVAPYLKNTITETHFSERNRQGRIVSFMARALYNDPRLHFRDIKAIASDEATAFCYGKEGIGRVYGRGEVFFLKGNAFVDRIEIGKSLHWEGAKQAVIVERLRDQARFDLQKWKGEKAISQYWWIDGNDDHRGHFEISLTAP